MVRFNAFAAWLLSSLGMALLVSSIVLAPSNTVMGQSGLAQCPGNTCANGCTSTDCNNVTFCIGTGCTCSNPNVQNCSACECKTTIPCSCGDK